MASTSTSTSASEAAMRLEIARLTGAINRYKSTDQAYRSTGYPGSRPKPHNTYVNPNYKLPPTPRPPILKKTEQASTSRLPAASQTRDVVIGGVTFQSSGRTLVRKDLVKSSDSTVAKSKPDLSFRRPAEYGRTARGDLVSTRRVYKPRASRGRGRPGNRNLTLNNSRDGRSTSKRVKYSDKPCPRFTTTGACSRGLTCMYQHDPSKIAICWNFLQGTCPNSAESCNLSHDPTPERTPLCVHFANNGRCTRANCPYPHVRVGVRQGVCRDFAVLGYCEKGIDCDKQHVRECPDFAEQGACSIKGCKLPHVIRANRNRKATTSTTATTGASDIASQKSIISSSGADITSQRTQAPDANMGDEYISLTFHESDSSEDDEDEDDEDDDEAGAQDEEGSAPIDDEDLAAYNED